MVTRFLNTTLYPPVKHQSRYESVYYQSSFYGKPLVPKVINVSEVEFPDEWILN